MNIDIFDSEEFKNTDVYFNFIREHKGTGNLKIRAFTINEALPVGNVHVIVSSLYENEKIIFFDGFTDDSGMISDISLPTTTIDNDNLIVPIYTEYEIEAFLGEYRINDYKVLMYDGVCVIQNIMMSLGDNYGD